MGWNSQNITDLLIVTSGSGFTGFFVYSPSPGKGNLILTVTGSTGTDPYGNSFQPLFNAGVWSAATGLLGQHFGINSSGTTFISSPDGVTRIKNSNNPPATIYYNDFGAIITYIDPASSAIWSYTDTGSAAQGTLSFGQVAASGGATDPVTSVAAGQGLTIFGNPVTNYVRIRGGSSVTNQTPAMQFFASNTNFNNGLIQEAGGPPANFTVYGPQQTTPSLLDFAGMLLESSNGAGAFAFGQLLYFDRSSVAHSCLTWGSTPQNVSIQVPLNLSELASAPGTPSGAGTLYVDSTGHLSYKGPLGTVTVLANP